MTAPGKNAGLRKILRIAWFDYRNRVFSKRFLLALFGIPAMLFIMGGFSVLIMSVMWDNRPVGYVDLAGFTLSSDASYGNLMYTTLVKSYKTEEEAHQALEKDEIQAFYVIEADYLTSGKVRRIEKESLDQVNIAKFSTFLSDKVDQHLIKLYKPAMLYPRLVLFGDDGSRNFSVNKLPNLALPLAGGLIFIIIIQQNSKYLLMAFVQEKENRTIEIITSSVTLRQLIIGKILGNMAVAFTIPVIWSLPVLFMLVVAVIPFFPFWNIEIHAGYILIYLLTFLPMLLIVAGLLTTLGAASTNFKNTDLLTWAINVVMLLPMAFSLQILIEPNGLLALVLSFFPLTASVTLGLRLNLTTVQPIEVVAIILIQMACAVGSFWLAGRSLKMSLYNYGFRIPLKKLFFDKSG